AITTRSGVSYDGPQIPPPPSSLSPVVENEPEATKDTVNPTNNGNTEDVQPQAVHPKPVTSLIFEPTITPVSASRPNPQASIPYPSRRNDERNCMAECLALADIGASINLMPYSVWKRLSLSDLTPKYMMLELADRSITSPAGIAEDVYVKAPAYQAPAPQTQGVSKEDFSSYVKANDAFVNSNTASTSNSGTLPSNTIANPRSDLKAITTRSGVSYDGPQIPPPPSSLPSVVENEPEATKDTVNPTNNGNTEDVQPHAVHPKPVTSLISEPTITPVSASRPNPQASIPYPSRRNDERNRERAKDQIEKFYQIFKDMSFEISFADALMLMPKFASTLKALIGNKEKLSEIARTPLNEHCSAVLLKKLPVKLGDPSKFLIPCDFSGMAKCLALADLGASINLMPYSVWKRLSLSELTPTCMTLELSDRSITRNYMPEVRKELKIYEAHFKKSSVDEPHVDELKELPPHLEYAFLKGDNKLPVIIAKDLSVEEKTALITILKSHKGAIAWKLSDIKGINPEFRTHKILMEEDFEPA
nr:reverse transcriptase domain-containing protein [Tanacetum cinerariifolium]